MPDPRDPIDGTDLTPSERNGVPVPPDRDEPPDNPDETESPSDMPEGIPDDPPEY